MSDDPITERKNAEAHLAELETFITKSRVYKGYVSATETAISEVKEAILINEPLDRKDEIESFKLRGDLRTLENSVTFFEDARQNLKTRIEEMLERENQRPSEDNE